MSAETFSFQAETKKLLDLMIHSLYSHKDVFLRELISNASDALDKRRFVGLTDESLRADGELCITLRVDPKARTLAVEDNGIGMTRDEVVENIGTIARSGTLEYLRGLEDDRVGEAAPELIGQFGVGFYASFMVADAVTLVTRRAGESGATRWSSRGDGEYTIEETERDEPGSTILLQLSPADADSGLADYTDEWVLRQIVKRYSDFVGHPIRLEIASASEGDEDAATPAGGVEPLNSMKAIWTRPEDEVDEDEYKEFYRHISHDFNDPLLHFATRIEGNFEARALLYVPAKAPFDLYHREMAHKGIQLYVKRVFIMDECRELMPEYLRFVKGVVDAEDVALNVSREMLQQDRQIQAICKHLVKKVLEALADLRERDADAYRSFWAEFGPVLKEGLLLWNEKRDRLLDLVLAASTHHESQLTTLAEYVERMSDDQEAIYYIAGASRDLIERSPHLEAFRDRGIEVLLLTDAVDEVWLGQMPPEFQGKPFKSVGKGEVELGSEGDEKEDAEEKAADDDRLVGLFSTFAAAIADDVKEVRRSRRLTTSPACLVREEGDMTPAMEAMLRQAGQEVQKVKPILEVNADHPLLKGLQKRFEADGKDPLLDDYAKLLYGQALLAEGGQIDDPAEFSRRVTELMLRALD